MKIPNLIKDIKYRANILGKDISIDTKELANINVYPITNNDDFLGFIVNPDTKNEDYCIFNNSVLKYAIDEGFDIDNIYAAFEKKLFTFIKKEDFYKKLFKENF